jgi:16S rRNA U1498 N3-methylase RsmE
MSKEDNTLKTKEKQYHHLTKVDRIKIESLINQKNVMEKDYLTIPILQIILELINLLFQEKEEKEERKKCI